MKNWKLHPIAPRVRFYQVLSKGNEIRRVVRPGGLELPTFWFVARRSIQLSYGRTV